MVKIPWMNARVMLEWTCQSCKGTGRGREHTWCDVCGAQYPDVDVDTHMMSCGHDWGHFQEESVACLECDGTGHGQEQVTVRELAEAIAEFNK